MQNAIDYNISNFKIFLNKPYIISYKKCLKPTTATSSNQFLRNVARLKLWKCGFGGDQGGRNLWLPCCCSSHPPK